MGDGPVARKNKYRKNILETTSAGFEPTRAEPTRFRVWRLNHSAMMPITGKAYPWAACHLCGDLGLLGPAAVLDMHIYKNTPSFSHLDP